MTWVTVQIITVEYARSLLDGQFGHSIRILNEDIFDWLGRVPGHIEFNTYKSADADLLVHNVVAGAESIRVDFIAKDPIFEGVTLKFL